MKILVTTDFSNFSKRALNEALNLARKAKSPQIHLVSVVETYSPYTLIAHYELPVPSVKQMESKMKRFVGKLKNRVKTHIVSSGTAADGVLKTARSINADLILIASHGVGAARTLLIGSTVQKLLAKSNIPVVVVTKNP